MHLAVQVQRKKDFELLTSPTINSSLRVQGKVFTALPFDPNALKD